MFPSHILPFWLWCYNIFQISGNEFSLFFSYQAFPMTMANTRTLSKRKHCLLLREASLHQQLFFLGKLQLSSLGSAVSGQTDGSCMIFLLMMSYLFPFQLLHFPFSFPSNQGNLTWFSLMRLALAAAISLMSYWTSEFPPSCMLLLHMQREERRAGFVFLPWANLAPWLLGQMEPRVTFARIPGPHHKQTRLEPDAPNHSYMGKLYVCSALTLTKEVLQTAFLSKSEAFQIKKK